MKNDKYSEFTKNAGATLRQCRNEKKVTLNAMAAALDVAPGTISGWERGVKPISLRRLAEMADVLGMYVKIEVIDNE